MILPLIYIAAPFRGPTPWHVRKNVEHARDLGLAVAQAGAYPVIPHTMTADFDKQLTDEFWLDGTMELLRRCDAIFLSSRWKLSRGAIAERAEAIDRDLPVFEEILPWTLLTAWVVAWVANRERAAQGLAKVREEAPL